MTWTIGHLAATLGFGRDARMGVLAGVSSAFANTVFIGLPLVSRLVGQTVSLRCRSFSPSICRS